jgi:hypothetical protein
MGFEVQGFGDAGQRQTLRESDRFRPQRFRNARPVRRAPTLTPLAKLFGYLL